MADLPEFLELTPIPDVADVLKLFRDCDGLILFESARRHEKLGRYSFLAAEPIEYNFFLSPRYGVDPFEHWRAVTERWEATTHPELPPFQGGIAGMLSYDLGGCWERLPVARHDEFQLPAAAIGCYNWVIAWDHVQNRCWVISHGFPAEEPRDRKRLAADNCARVAARIRSLSPVEVTVDEARSRDIEIETSQHAVKDAAHIDSNFSESQYLFAVQRVIDYIKAGDIFQANLSQRLLAKSDQSTLDLYLALRKHNPAPFAGLIQFADWAVLSSSPERFIQKSGDRIWTRPIKGTRQRHLIPEADLYSRDELRESEKDHAENVMIVDLLRNDLSRVCRPGTVRVPELCAVETYETVTHLVSEVTGQLQLGKSFWDVMRATFPGGSITGAPKIRAMEIITELEQVTRGPYCGSLFYCGFDGTADSNILIRTVIKRDSQLAFPVGGGIVAQSIPQQEYEETLHKAAGMVKALSST